MGAAVYRFKIERGATFFKRLTWYANPDKSAMKDLSGYSAMLQARRQEDGQVLFQLSSANNSIILGGPGGTIDLKMTAEETSNLPRHLVAKYQLELTSSTGEVLRLLGGFIETDEELVKPIP